MHVTYPVNSDAKSMSFGLAKRTETWKETNLVRKQIADGGQYPITYDQDGNYLVEGWQRGRK